MVTLYVRKQRCQAYTYTANHTAQYGYRALRMHFTALIGNSFYGIPFKLHHSHIYAGSQVPAWEPLSLRLHRQAG